MSLLLIFFLAVLLRLINLNQSFWLDEAIGVVAANQFSYQGLITEFMRFDNHPPGYYLLLKFWGDLFSYSEVAIRLLSVVFGVATVGMVYAIAKELNPNSGRWPLLSALFLATAPLHIYYSQEARMYPMAAFAATLAIYFFIKVLRRGKLLEWSLFSISLIFLASTDYVPLFLFPVFWLVPWVLRKDFKWFSKLTLSHFPLAVVSASWLPLLFVQAKGSFEITRTLPGWKSLIGGATIKQVALFWIKSILGRISFFNKVVYGSVIVASSIPVLIALFSSWVKRDKVLVLWFWFLVPPILSWLFSFIIPSFSYFRLLYVLPAFYLLLAWGVVSLGRWGRILGIAIISVNLFAGGVYALNDRFQREDWRAATSFVESQAGEGDVVLFEFSDPFAPYKWYSSGKVEAAGAFEKVRGSRQDEARIKELVDGKSGVYHFIYLRDLTDPEKLLGQVLTDEGFFQSKVYDFRGIGHVIYWEKVGL